MMQEKAQASTPYGALERSSGPSVSFPPPVHSIIFAILGVIIQHIQNKCQSMKISPYEEQNGITLGIYISLFLYAMALLAEFGCKISNHALLLLVKRFSPILGTLVVIMHIFLLSFKFGCFTLTLWAIFLVESLLSSLQEMMQIYRCLSDKLSSISEIMNAYFHSISEKTKKYFHWEDELPQ
ncbi:hypothetical protein L6164_000712 [Bauhinia variegata]|uniref:Uncharacterized protein n=1 Tax=Bauhinia variegata TaxID=167791 RepID=A0ACB9Q7F0_BAUVA|nr:hypothetical protein L6164_000712 [Bauhinia variegata]